MYKGWSILVHSLRVLRDNPIFIVPIFVVWTVYAPTILYLKYAFDWNHYGIVVDSGVVFCELFLFSFIILASFAVMLEMIRQREFGERLSLGAASARLLDKDLARLIPLALVWAIIWFVLTLVEIAVSRDNQTESDEQFSAQSAAQTLAGFQHFTFSRALLDALNKGIRMVIFLVLPGIIWERLGLLPAVKKGLVVLKTHISTFVTGYMLTYLAAGIAFLPAGIVLELGTGRNGNPPLFHFPSSVWVGVIIYVGLAWSFSLYLEQIFMANLYFWQMNWQKAAAQAQAQGEPIPHFTKAALPALLSLPQAESAD